MSGSEQRYSRRKDGRKVSTHDGHSKATFGVCKRESNSVCHVVCCVSVLPAELSKWYADLDSSFSSASSKLESSKLIGSEISKWDLTTDQPWGENLQVTNPYHRAAMWANWKQALRTVKQ